MKITQDVRDYAATLNDPNSVGLSINGTIEDGMARMSAKHVGRISVSVIRDRLQEMAGYASLTRPTSPSATST
jgi:hypothetical protein